MRRLDLNLLAVLDALLDEASVTAAARRLHLAQPTVSNALARLREHFGDPLLVRAGRTMRPTPKARQLVGPLRDALTAIDRAVTGNDSFEPSSSDRIFRIATTDYIGIVLLPQLLAHLGRNAPCVGIAVTELAEARPFDALRMGEVDLLIGSLSPPAPGMQFAELFSDRYVCVLRRDHPRIGRRMTLRQFLDASHMAIRRQHGGATGLIDAMLAHKGVQRRIAVSLPHFLSAPAALLASDVVLTVGARAAHVLQRDFALKCLAHPLPLRPFAISQAWHQRSNEDPGHAWLRRVLTEQSARLPTTSPSRRAET